MPSSYGAQNETYIMGRGQKWVYALMFNELWIDKEMGGVKRNVYMGLI